MADRPEKDAGAQQGAADTASPGDAAKAPVVGVGASAGGLVPFQAFVGRIAPDSGIAWVLVQHMAPDYSSELAAILQRCTELPVAEVREPVRAEPNHVYVIAPGHTMTIRDGMLSAVTDHDPLARRTSIDAFLVSLAADAGERCGCALLSGAGTDGTIGLKAVKEAGGLTLTQAIGEAEYDSMLLSAVRTGLVDRELAVEEMPEVFTQFLVRRPLTGHLTVREDERQQICALMHETTGHDFEGYKTSTVDRRIRRRMQVVGTEGVADYLEHLRADRGEATRLFRDLLIGVTQFFRDPDAFAALASKAIPQILQGRTADDEIRIWVPGCATGEEAYSLAMLFQEHAEKLGSVPAIRVFGSDIDDAALHVARLGRYPKGIAADVSPERLEHFFDAEDGTLRIRPKLREMCLFAQHNVLRDPPFSRIDLVSCRNMLIYMNTDLQRRLLPVFHYALRPDGYVFLGPAEGPTQAPRLFREIDRRHRIFQRLGDAIRLPDFPLAGGDGRHRGRLPGGRSLSAAPGDSLGDIAARHILAAFAPAWVVIASDFEILEASAGTGRYLELPGGPPRTNLGAMARSGLGIDIRAAVASAKATGEREVRAGLTIGTGEARRSVTVVAEPITGSRHGEPLYLVVFQEGPPPADSPSPPHDRADEVRRALEMELQTTKERLQSTLEELETSTEEIKAANEELSSVNEELQSSNEELETSKEELQSVNEELRTVNNELLGRIEEADRANNDLKNLFANTEIAMLFLDDQFRIMNFTPPAKPLFHLRDQDVGRPLDELAGHLDFGGLKQQVQQVIRDGGVHEREVQANGGEAQRTFILRILPYADQNNRTRGAVLLLVDITARKRSEMQLSAMLSELNHRVKNSLASVQAMLRQSRSGARTVAEFAESFEGRLQAMAASHSLLSEASWRQAGLPDVARAVLRPFAEPETPRLSLEGQPFPLRSNTAVSMGLILHELATNAAKYGAWSVPGGHVALHWEIADGDGDAGTLRITWSEAGGPPARQPEQEGFGLRYIRNCIEYELNGSLETTFADGGLSCRMDVPVAGLRAAPGDDFPFEDVG